MDAIRRRPRLYRVARRLARTPPAQVARARLLRPQVSVIVPIYNVEEYLAACLDSLEAQTLPRLRGRARRRRVARRLARDRRGVRRSRPAHPHRHPPERRAGRGPQHRGPRGPRPLPDLPRLRRRAAAARPRDAPPRRGHHRLGDRRRRHGALRLRCASGPPPGCPTSTARRCCGSRWRTTSRSCATSTPATSSSAATSGCAQDLWFREGVAYEDQPLVTQLLGRARSIDLVPDVVYRYRARDDRSSISQQTASLKDLRDRIAAWRVSRDVIRAEFSDGRVRRLADHALPGPLPVVPAPAPGRRTTRTGRSCPRRSARSPTRRRRSCGTRRTRRSGSWSGWPSSTGPATSRSSSAAAAPRSTAGPPGCARTACSSSFRSLGDPELPDELFRRSDPTGCGSPTPSRTSTGRATAARPTACWISGWAYVLKVDLATHDQRVTIELRDDRTRRGPVLPRRRGPGRVVRASREDLWCDYSPGRFGVPLPDRRAGPAARPRRVWTVWVKVEVAGFTVDRPVTRLIRSGSAGVVPAASLADGSRVIPVWQFARELEAPRRPHRRDGRARCRCAARSWRAASTPPPPSASPRSHSSATTANARQRRSRRRALARHRPAGRAAPGRSTGRLAPARVDPRRLGRRRHPGGRCARRARPRAAPPRHRAHRHGPGQPLDARCVRRRARVTVRRRARGQRPRDRRRTDGRPSLVTRNKRARDVG